MFRETRMRKYAANDSAHLRNVRRQSIYTIDVHYKGQPYVVYLYVDEDGDYFNDPVIEDKNGKIVNDDLTEDDYWAILELAESVI